MGCRSFEINHVGIKGTCKIHEAVVSEPGNYICTFYDDDSFSWVMKLSKRIEELEKEASHG
jgi:hypothetical protein